MSTCRTGASYMRLARIWQSHRCSTTFSFLLIALFVSTINSCTTYDSAGQPVGHPDDAHTLTLTIVDGIELCNDIWSKPEYYATALRRDPIFEKELRAIALARSPLSTKIREIEEIIEPLKQRKHNIEKPSDEVLLKLAKLREKAQVLIEHAENPETATNEESNLEIDLDEVTSAIESLANRMPLNREEILLLNEKQKELASFLEARSQLDSRRNVLLRLVVMRTPDSLIVYPNDSLRIRLMEKDVHNNDICATWDLVLDEKILYLGGKSLSKWGKRSLRMSVEPVNP